MHYLLLLFLGLFQAASGFATDPLNLPVARSDQPLKSDEIKKITKLLENPQERDKLLKTLKALAAVREAEEVKEGGLVSYLTPVIKGIADGIANIGLVFKKTLLVFNDLMAYLKQAKNRQDIGAALQWFLLLMGIGIIFERGLRWFFNRRLKIQAAALSLKPEQFEEKKYAYAYFSLLYPFLFSPFLAFIFIKSPSIIYWIMGFWIFLYSLRTFLLERTLSRALPLLFDKTSQTPTRKRWLFSRVFIGIAFWLILVYGLDVILDRNQHKQDHLINMTLFFSIPILVLQLREWQINRLSGYLEESYQLMTIPQILIKPINLCIQYLPWLFLSLGSIFIVNATFFGVASAQSGGLGSAFSFVVLLIFLWGRHHIDELTSGGNRKRLQSLKFQVLASFVSSYLPQVAKAFQWGWHIFFLTALMAIWSRYFSEFLSTLLSHPFMKTLTSLGVIWGIIGLFWLSIKFLVQLRTMPHDVKGKRKEPTAFAKTFGFMIQSVLQRIMIFTALFMSLEVFGFDLKPLVYLMSAFAFAISLGSQSLVKDILNGFFTLVDGNIAVGDTVTIGNYTGTVESLSMRAIFLRHSTGALQRIPFSEVSSTINKSRDYTVVPIDVTTSYRTNIGSVYDVLMRTGEEIANDPVFGKMILEKLTISGIDKFADHSVNITASIKIKPDPAGSFFKEFNRRLKVHMDAAGIQPPIAFHEPWTSSPAT